MTFDISGQLSQLATATVLTFVGAVVSISGPGPVDERTPVLHALSSIRPAAAHASTGDVEGLVAGGGRIPIAQKRVPDGGASRSFNDGDAPVDSELNENFGPVRADDGELHVGEGGNGLGPYGADRTVSAAPAGQKTKARAKARYEAPRCDGDIVVGGETTYRCDGAGHGSAGVETEAGGQQHEVGTSP